MKCSEVSYGEVLVDKGEMYIRVTLYLIIFGLFHLGVSCSAFVLICTVVVLYCVCVCVCVCVGFVTCGYSSATVTDVFPCSVTAAGWIM